MLIWHHDGCKRQLQLRPKAHLERLISHEDVTIQGEAELAPLKESAVGLRMLAVCTQAPH